MEVVEEGGFSCIFYTQKFLLEGHLFSMEKGRRV